MNRRRERGKLGEDIACKYLLQRGYRILSRNYRTRYGEVDIVAQRDACLVFVEVKARSGGAYGLPRDAVDARKQGRLYRCAQQYMQENSSNFHEQTGIRIDVIEVYLLGDSVKVHHIPAAITDQPIF